MKPTQFLAAHIGCVAIAILTSCSPPVERTDAETKPESGSDASSESGKSGSETIGTASPSGIPIVSTATPAPTPTPPPRPANPNDFVKTHGDSLVFVSGGDGAGSGFIADMGGKPFLLTNAHVAAGVRGAIFKTMQGALITPGSASVAVGHDILAMQATSIGTPFEIMRDVGKNVEIGDEVVVLGNAEGSGVINTITGSVVGIGPELVEIDAPFQPGNSGSPIVHLKSKKVIGVATYLTIRKYDPATRQPVLNPVVRRFGYRVDSVKTWQPINWGAFYAQATEIDNVEKLTNDFIFFIKDLADDSRVTRSRHTNPAIRSRIDAWIDSKSKRMSPRDATYVDQNFLSFLKVTSQADIAMVRTHLTYDYFQRQLGDQQRERSEIAGVFSKIIESAR